MITGDDLKRLEEDNAKVGKKLLIVETMQFFEIEVPADIDCHEFVDTDECKQICADKILSGLTDLKVERVFPDYDEVNEEWS